MVTKGLGKTVDAMINTDQYRFPNPPLREKQTPCTPTAPIIANTREKKKAPTSSFYSLHVWNYVSTGSGDIDWNPGNNDPDTGGTIDEKLVAAIRSAMRGSMRRQELERRQEYLWRAVGPMTYGEPTANWWDGAPPRLASNGTGGAVNLTHGCFANDCDGASASS